MVRRGLGQGRFLAFLFTVLLLAPLLPIGSGSPLAWDTPSPRAVTGTEGVWFEPNWGQAPQTVRAIGYGPGIVLFEATQITFLLPSRPGPTVAREPQLPATIPPRQDSVEVLTLSLEGASRDATIRLDDERGARSHYYLGDDPRSWTRDVPHHGRIVYEGVYPGIDLAFYGTPEGDLEYDLLVAPGASVSRFKLAFPEHARLEILEDGSLQAQLGNVTFRQQAPVSYAPTPTGDRPVASRFTIEDSHVGIVVEGRDTSLPLIVDPVVPWVRVFGGDAVVDTAVAYRPDGHVYLLGTARSPFYPNDNPTGIEPHHDAAILHLGADGQLIERLLLGGQDDEFPSALRFTAAGALAVVGTTDSTDLPTVRPFQSSRAGRADAFVAVFNAELEPTLVSYLGGSENDHAWDVAESPDGKLFVAGDTESQDFPHAGGWISEAPTGWNSFVSLVHPAEGSLVASRKFGGDGRESATRVEVRQDGMFYVSGTTRSGDLQVRDPIVSELHGSSDGFLGLFHPGTGDHSFLTYLGGQGAEVLLALTLDHQGIPVVGGITSDISTFDVAPTWIPPGAEPRFPAFIMKVDPASREVLWAHGIGGDFDTWIRAAKHGADGSLWLFGETVSANIMVVDPVHDRTDPAIAGTSLSQLLMNVNPETGELLFSTLLGEGWLHGLGLDVLGDEVVVSGMSTSRDFPSQPYPTTTQDWDFLTVAKFSPGSIRRPGAPAPISAEIDPVAGTIRVRWSNPEDPGGAILHGFSISRAHSLGPETLIATPKRSQFEFLDKAPLPNGTNVYRVRTWSLGGTSEPAIVCASLTPDPLDTLCDALQEDLFSADFEEDEQSWNGSGLWHEAWEDDPPFNLSATGQGAWWFGNATTGTYEGSYNGYRGYDLRSPTIDLTHAEAPVLTFASWYESQDTDAAWDRKDLLIVQPNSTTPLNRVIISGTQDFRQWSTRQIDLSEFRGQEIQLLFRFTTSALDNAHRGWYVDTVRIFEDHDGDGVATRLELLQGSNPVEPDTDGDGIRDAVDARPRVEDLPPAWTYWVESGSPHGRVGEIVFHPEGFANVNISAPSDASGLTGVSFAMELHGQAPTGEVNATVRLDLEESPWGTYVGSFPLPRNFEDGHTDRVEIVVAATDVHSNVAALPARGDVRVDFGIPWTRFDPPPEGLAFLEYADLRNVEGSPGLSTSRASTVPLIVPLEPEDGDIAEPLQGNVPFTTPNAKAYWAQLWAGLREEHAPRLPSAVAGFVFSCEHEFTASCAGGDALAGVLVVGDIRDITVGYLEDDDLILTLGAIGLAFTVGPPADGFYSAVKPVIKQIGKADPVFAKRLGNDVFTALTTEPGLVAKNGDAFRGAITKAASSPTALDALRRFDAAYPGKHALFRLGDAHAVDALETLFAKYGPETDALLARLTAETSRIAEPEHLVALARAEKLLGKDVLGHAADVAHVPGVENVLNNLAKAPPHSAKGYAFELEAGASAVGRGERVNEFGLRIKDLEFADADKVLVTSVLDGDVVDDLGDGLLRLTEVKNVNHLSATTRVKNQLLKLAAARDIGKVADVRLIVEEGTHVTKPVLEFAEDAKVPVYRQVGAQLVRLQP